MADIARIPNSKLNSINNQNEACAGDSFLCYSDADMRVKIGESEKVRNYNPVNSYGSLTPPKCQDPNLNLKVNINNVYSKPVQLSTEQCNLKLQEPLGGCELLVSNLREALYAVRVLTFNAPVAQAAHAEQAIV